MYAYGQHPSGCNDVSILPRRADSPARETHLE